MILINLPDWVFPQAISEIKNGKAATMKRLLKKGKGSRNTPLFNP
jgi:hypothetical protein